jgi:hypothetical protein
MVVWGHEPIMQWSWLNWLPRLVKTYIILCLLDLKGHQPLWFGEISQLCSGHGSIGYPGW